MTKAGAGLYFPLLHSHGTLMGKDISSEGTTTSTSTFFEITSLAQPNAHLGPSPILDPRPNEHIRQCILWSLLQQQQRRRGCRDTSRRILAERGRFETTAMECRHQLTARAQALSSPTSSPELHPRSPQTSPPFTRAPMILAGYASFLSPLSITR